MKDTVDLLVTKRCNFSAGESIVVEIKRPMEEAHQDAGLLKDIKEAVCKSCMNVEVDTYSGECICPDTCWIIEAINKGASCEN